MSLASESSPHTASPLEPSRKVLLVDHTKELRLALTPLLRAAGCEVVSVDSLLAARAELTRCRPLAVVADWRAFPAEGGGALRGHPQEGAVPLLAVVSEATPVEMLEACARAGAEDCLFAPVRAPELRARLEALRAREPRPVSAVMERRAARTVLLVGEEAAVPGGLGEDLEACGHHLLYAPTLERAASRLRGDGEPPQLLLVRPSTSAPEAMLQLERLRSGTRLAHLPTVVITPEDGVRAPRPGLEWWSGARLSSRELLARVNALLQRGRDTLRVDERVPFVCPVEFREAGGAPWSSCFSQALSPGALFVRTLVPARTSAALELRILLPTTSEVLEAPGLVSWSNPYSPRRAASYPLGMGVQFLGMGSQRLMRLLELVRAHR